MAEALTEEQIERAVQIRMDALDRRLINGELREENYERLVRALDDWAKAQYELLKWTQRMKEIKELG